MNPPPYFTKVAALRASVEQQLPLLEDSSSSLHLDYLKCQANLKHLLGKNHISDYPLFFKQVLTNGKWADLDHNEPYAWKQVQCTGTIPFTQGPLSVPYLFCTFHLGSYFLINHILVDRLINYTLLIGGTFYEKENNDLAALFRQHEVQKHLPENYFRMLSATQDGVLRSMIQEIRQGRSLLTYLDGNSGSGSSQQNENLLSINFLGRKLRARQGMAYVSYLTETPIIPVVSYRDESDRAVVEFLPALTPDKTIQREVCCQQMTQQLYDLFAGYVQRYPEQWEGWTYVDMWLEKSVSAPMATPIHSTASYRLDDQRYSVYSKGQTAYLFDTDTYGSLKISPGLSKFIQKMKRSALQLPYPHLQELIHETLLTDLITKGVLVEC